MKDCFSISDAAKMTGMTSEALRHYDRIDLVKPSHRDEWTGYRGYSRQDIVRLNTIQALRCMDLSLAEIRKLLEYDRLEDIVGFLKQAEKRADDKIARLQYAKTKIGLARTDYENKLRGQREEDAPFTLHQSERVILLSDTLTEPSLHALWNYHSHFYEQLPLSQRDAFTFEDLAGLYTEKGESRLFAVCLRHGEAAGLKILPAGIYLCADCTEDSREAVLSRLLETAQTQYDAVPTFVLQLIVVSGILQWRYQIQLLLQAD